MHAGHRISQDGDHVLSDLRAHFDEVLAALEAVAGWTTARVQWPVLILEQLNGVLTGIRQLRRTEPHHIYAQHSGASPLAEVAERLAAAAPSDRNSVELATYRGQLPPWNNWSHLADRGHHWAPLAAAIAMEEPDERP
jgi:hypothetical protein